MALLSALARPASAQCWAGLATSAPALVGGVLPQLSSEASAPALARAFTTPAVPAATPKAGLPCQLNFTRGFAYGLPPDWPNDCTTIEDEPLMSHHYIGKAGAKDTYQSGYIAPHPGLAGRREEDISVLGNQESFVPKLGTYSQEYVESITPTHVPVNGVADRLGLSFVWVLRKIWDTTTGYGPNMTEKKWLDRIIFLESVAGIPGMVAGMLRHLKCMRTMRRDRGWIHVLLEEAENERMHLVTFMEIRRPGYLFRLGVIAAQGFFFNLYFVLYLLWPRACHAFVGYLEEEAVRTYTHLIHDIEAGKAWKDMLAPEVGKVYWNLGPEATMRDLMLAVRADEACHSFVNHTLKNLDQNAVNPFAAGKSQLP